MSRVFRQFQDVGYSENMIDDAIDCINYLAFFIVCAERNRMKGDL